MIYSADLVIFIIPRIITYPLLPPRNVSESSLVSTEVSLCLGDIIAAEERMLTRLGQNPHLIPHSNLRLLLSYFIVSYKLLMLIY